MSNKFIFLIVIVVIALIAGVIYYAPFDDPAEIVDNNNNGDVAGVGSGFPESVNADHYYADGRHIVNGVIELPTPCHSLDTSVAVAESFPEQVTIQFTSNAGSSVCTQLIAEKFFSVTFDASEGASIRATYNGDPIEIILSEAGDPSAIQKL